MNRSLIQKNRGILLSLFLILSITFSAMAQDVMVSGKVTDNKGEPLPGVSIAIKGTTDGTITDIDGNYSLSANGNAELIFNFVGFEPQTVSVNNRSTISVIMQEDVKSIDEVVVVGYGQMKRTDLTGSVVSVSSDAIEQSVSTNIDQVLQGRAAGVQVTQNSGTPGGGSSIRIRGINSLNGSNEPIFVIDGVVIDGSTESNNNNALSSINPSDIVTMDILKDASATAIYGSRGANGVIIITTKRGEKGESRISYDGYMGLQKVPKKLELLNLQEYAYHKNERTEIMKHPKDDAFVRPDLLGEGTDWQDELFQVAKIQSHNLSISGGNDKSNYAFGAGYLNQDGIALGSGFKRLNLRGNIDSEVKSWLKMGVNFNVSNTTQQLTVSDESLINIALTQTPNVAVRNADGSFDGPETNEFVHTNPVGIAMLKENSNEKTGIRSSIYTQATIIKGLTLKTEFSSDIGMNNTYKFTPSYKFGAKINDVVESDRSKSYNKFWTWRNILTYNKSLNESHTITMMLGHEMQESAWEYLSGYRKGFLTNTAHDLNAGDATTAKNNGSSGGNSLLSYFGRAFYSFQDKYLITATLRNDGSSKFAKGNKWELFPSTAVAWKISNESFLQGNPVINNLKLRVGWGMVGNQNLANNYAYTSIMAPVATIWGTGLLSGNTPNPDLKWEITNSTNLGLDINLLQNRIEFIADVYYKKTKNLLMLRTLPGYAGSKGQGSTTPPWTNIGSLENKGVELTLNTVNLHRGSFKWRSNFIFSLNRNKVLSLDTETGVIDKTLRHGSEEPVVTRTAVGKPAGQFYGYKVVGRFNKATDFYYKDGDGNVVATPIPEGININENGVWIGDLQFADISDDGIINDDDLDFIGNPEPKFTYGIGNTLSYKGFDLTIYLNGSYGNKVLNWNRRWLDDPRQNTNISTRAIDFARLSLIDPEGPNDFRNVYISSGGSQMPRLSTSDANENSRVSDRFIEDGSYLRIQNISLAYSLPHKWLSTIGIYNVKVYANLQNIYTFTKYKGYDPEIGALNQDALMTGIDDARYPTPTIYTFGLNITF